MKNIKAILAQLNFCVGDVEGNTKKIIDAIHSAEKEKSADLIIFPELTLTGYPAQDFWFKTNLEQAVQKALEKILRIKTSLVIILGYIKKNKNKVYNEAAVIQNGKIISTYQKNYLPNYSVFDEKRYFTAGKKSPCIFTFQTIKIALLICEDIWLPSPIQRAAHKGAQLVIVINASPFTCQKYKERLALLKKRACANNLPIVYVNQIGGQDELVFDGGSLVVNAKGEVIEQAPFFKETLWEILLRPREATRSIPVHLNPLEAIYSALLVGTHDYIEKNHFKGALIGLSGGVDSALTLAIAVDAIGKERVRAVMMPSRFTSDESLNAAKQQASHMGVVYDVMSIEPIFEQFLSTLKFSEKGIPAENLQARCRGTLLMALSNETGYIVLTTSNKSEMAVGYATLYGDMAGGFSVLKDVYKTKVYQLAEYRNQISPTILPQIIQRAPSAELAYNQKDEDLLPPYNLLDTILEQYIEKNQTPEQIIKNGFDPELVKEIIKKIHQNEYKRKQSAVGIKITPVAFGKDWRFPLTQFMTTS